MGAVTAEDILELADSYADGLRAGTAGEPVSLCPHGPQDPDGYPWRLGWLEATAARREDAGTFDHTREFYETVRQGPEFAPLRPDPTVAILAGDTDEILVDGEWRPAVPLSPLAPLQEALATLAAQLAPVVDACNQAFTMIGNALSATLDELEPIFAALQGILTERPMPPPRSCPRHGLELRGGSCQRCNRDRARSHHGSRGRH